MRKLEKPILDGTSPILYKGTLSDKVDELLRIQSKIEKIKKVSDSVPSYSLLEKRVEIEREISRHLINGEEIEGDYVLDYCMRHFTGIDYMENRVRKITSAFDIMPRVEKFSRYVSDNIGKPIVLMIDGSIKETGIISDHPEFSVVNNFRYLHIPTDNSFEFTKNRHHKRKEDPRIYVNPDIFAHPGRSFGEGIWTTDHSKLFYVGGHGPKETKICIGDCSP